MRETYDWIFLSPHLDDVALSCGGQIFQYTEAGAWVLIVTIMAGDPPSALISTYVDALHERWALAKDAVAARRQEDLAANQILSAETLHLAWPDCIYRQDPESGSALYLSDADIFGEIAPSEIALVEHIAHTLATLPNATHLVAPLGVGHHVDHQLTRAAAEHHFGASNLWYYEEYPYAAQSEAVVAVVGDGHGWHKQVQPLTQSALGVKYAAIAAFQSQLSTFFQSRADLEQQVLAFAHRIGGERLWRQSL